MKYKCPECNSEDLYVTETRAFKLNTGEFDCDLIKMYDTAAEVHCGDCSWRGFRYDVKENE